MLGDVEEDIKKGIFGEAIGMYKVNYNRPISETSRQVKAWRIGGLKVMLALLCKEFGKEKVLKELKEIMKDEEPEISF